MPPEHGPSDSCIFILHSFGKGQCPSIISFARKVIFCLHSSHWYAKKWMVPAADHVKLHFLQCLVVYPNAHLLQLPWPHVGCCHSEPLGWLGLKWWSWALYGSLFPKLSPHTLPWNGPCLGAPWQRQGLRESENRVQSQVKIREKAFSAEEWPERRQRFCEFKGRYSYRGQGESLFTFKIDLLCVNVCAAMCAGMHVHAQKGAGSLRAGICWLQDDRLVKWLVG